MLEYSVRLVHTPPPAFLVVLNKCKFDNRDDCRGFLGKKKGFAERVLREFSGACVDLSQEAPKQLASSVVTGDKSA